MLKTAFELQEQKKLALTYNIRHNGTFSIMFDIKQFCDLLYEPIKNRIFGEDKNPNFYGWIIVDWLSPNEFKIIDYGVEDLTLLNKKEDELKEMLGKASTGRYHYTEMKEHIMKLLAVSFSKLAKHYRCECTASDEIAMESSNKKKGKWFNRLVNNKWNRNVYDETIQKNNQLNGLYVDGVYSAYTSVNGNFVFRSTGLPDMCLAALEMTRREYLYRLYNVSEFQKNNDMYVFPEKDDFSEMFDQACDELNIPVKNRNLSIKEIYNKHLKKTKNGYRVSLEKVIDNMNKTEHKKRYTTSYTKK